MGNSRKKVTHRAMLSLLGILVSLSLILLAGCGEQGDGANGTESTVLGNSDPRVMEVMAIQDSHTAGLLDDPEIVGTATGLTDEGVPALVVFTRSVTTRGIPDRIEGVPVVVKVSGAFFALHHRPGHGGGPGGGGGGEDPSPSLSPTDIWPLPVPIGLSTGNIGECSAGTIGARVTDGTDVYALSNNHVYALENVADIGSSILQPGRFDTNCETTASNIIGALAAFEPLVFSTTANNTIDAAIASSSTVNLGNATPADGYGTPRTATVSEAVGLAVQKYGRTTSLTKGIITGINGTIKVGYSSGTARFIQQIIVQSNKPFIKAGDSGSLLVTDPDRNPVGLLFAGNRSGKLAVANPIQPVLANFDVTVDGE